MAEKRTLRNPKRIAHHQLSYIVRPTQRCQLPQKQYNFPIIFQKVRGIWTSVTFSGELFPISILCCIRIENLQLPSQCHLRSMDHIQNTWSSRFPLCVSTDATLTLKDNITGQCCQVKCSGQSTWETGQKCRVVRAIRFPSSKGHVSPLAAPRWRAYGCWAETLCP